MAMIITINTKSISLTFCGVERNATKNWEKFHFATSAGLRKWGWCCEEQGKMSAGNFHLSLVIYTLIQT